MERLACIFILMISVGCSVLQKSEAVNISGGWQPWSQPSFTAAKQSGRLVLLNLYASWEYDSYQMEQTYKDGDVVAAIEARYVPIRLAYAAHPGLTSRFANSSWPITVIFDSEGREVAFKTGYLDPGMMEDFLEETAANPTPQYSEPTYASEPTIEGDFLKEMSQRHITNFDQMQGGYIHVVEDPGKDKFVRKYVDPYLVEYALALRKRDFNSERIARSTLDSGMTLLDSSWGGAYQYSENDWYFPHYAKLLPIQSYYIRLYSLAHLALGDKKYLRVPREVDRYFQEFMGSPEGTFYISQAEYLLTEDFDGKKYFWEDSKERKKRGIPTVDKSVYTNENGWAIDGLATAYGVTGKDRYIKKAQKAAQWFIKNRSLGNGGFSHDESSKQRYLGDTLAMSAAFLRLYSVTGERKWLELAKQGADFIEKNFKHSDPGYLSVSTGTIVLPQFKDIDENIALARFANRLSHYTRDDAHREMAVYAMRYLAAPEIATQKFKESGVLVASYEFKVKPLHIIVVGSKDDRQANELFKAAQELHDHYKIVEWWDRQEPPLPGLAVEFPQQQKAAAYVYTNGQCSEPMMTIDQIKQIIKSEG